MSEAWVLNASRLILLSRIDRLDLIEHLAPVILVPNAVIDEVRAGQDKDRMAAAALKWAERYRVEDATVVASIEHWDLGLGESQVIAHSVGGSRWAVLDDRAARRCTVAHGVPVIGTLGTIGSISAVAGPRAEVARNGRRGRPRRPAGESRSANARPASRCSPSAWTKSVDSIGSGAEDPRDP